jgi:hypothetical protein
LVFFLDLKFSTNQIQSFDRLYRRRSESQPPREAIQEIPNEQQELIDNQQVKFLFSIEK